MAKITIDVSILSITFCKCKSYSALREREKGKETENGRIVGLEAEVVELVFPLGDDLVIINPDVALAGQHIDMGL